MRPCMRDSSFCIPGVVVAKDGRTEGSEQVRRGLARFFQNAVAPPEENQGTSRFRSLIKGKHSTDHNPVISAFVNLVQDAAQCCRAPFQPGPAFPGKEAKGRRRRLFPSARKVGRKRFLIVAKDVYGKSPRRMYGPAGIAGLTDAEQHERGI